MVDANAVAGSSTGLHTTGDLRHRSRIHFSDDHSSSGAEASPQAARTSGSSPAFRKFHLASGATAEPRSNGGDERQRVNSLGRADNTSPFGTTSTRKSADAARGGKALKDSYVFGHPSAADSFGPGALADEYDLCE